ncbi:MAG: hypothetical protein PHN20_04240, partial [Bacteroidales bacterium]|nr:hypothetical protein [Bacteroidales bacterium]
SVLTFDFAAVYFRLGNEKQFAFSGVYSEGDSNLMDCLENPAYTSLNFTQATDIPTTSNWADLAANPNCLYYVSSDLSMSAPNVVAGTNAQNIRLQADQGDFYAPPMPYWLSRLPLNVLYRIIVWFRFRLNQISQRD